MEASRRNNTSLLETVLASFPRSDPSALAVFLNTSTDALGSTALHVAATYGNYEILDILLDQEGVEIDNPERREGDTPLHSAVRYANTSGSTSGEGKRVVEILLDAGCDPRTRNAARLKPVELADPGNKEVRKMLQNAEYAIMAGDDVVRDDSDGPASD